MPKELSLKEKLASLRKLESVNEKALGLFEKIQNSLESRNSNELFKNYVSLLRQIDEMAYSYQDMSLPENYIAMSKRFMTVEQETTKTIKDLVRKIYFSRNEELILPVKIIDLKYNEDEHGHDNFEVCTTLHDFIRCLHSSAVNHVSSGVGLKNPPKVKVYGDNVFTIIQDEDYNQDLINTMKELYIHGESKRGTENYTLLVTQDGLSSRVKMGCHFSALEIVCNGSKSDFILKFMNSDVTKYPKAPKRAEYIEKIMHEIGFIEVTNLSGKLITGKSYNLERKELLALLKSSIRMLASSKDLDLGESKLEEKMDKAVKAFKDGKLNIYNYLVNE